MSIQEQLRDWRTGDNAALRSAAADRIDELEDALRASESARERIDVNARRTMAGLPVLNLAETYDESWTRIEGRGSTDA